MPALEQKQETPDPNLERFLELVREAETRREDSERLAFTFASISKTREQLRYALSEREATIFLEVERATNPQGKPLCTNEQARKAEAFLRLQADEEAGRLRSHEMETVEQGKQMEAAIETLSRAERWARLEAEMLVALAIRKNRS